MRKGVNARNHSFEAVTVLGQPMLFTETHLDHSTIPKGMYLYAVRHHSEDLTKPIQICQWAVANRMGFLLSVQPIALTKHPKLDNSVVDIDPDKDWLNSGYIVTLQDYLHVYPVHRPQNRDQER